MTSEEQPLDQGIISAFKLSYHTRLLESCVNHVEELNSCEGYAKQVKILDAIRYFATSIELVVDHPDASESLTLEIILSYTFHSAASVEEYTGYNNNHKKSEIF